MKYPLLHVVNSAPLKLVIVNPRLEELNTHYIGRTVVCSEKDGQPCWLKHADVGRPRYGAWLCVLFPGTLKPAIVRLTGNALAVEPRLRDERLDLRGLTVELCRQGSNELCEMHAKLVIPGERQEKLPAAIDLRFAIERMLEAEDRDKVQRKAALSVLSRGNQAALFDANKQPS